METLHALQAALKRCGQRLVLLQGEPVAAISALVGRYAVDRVVVSHPVGADERKQLLRFAIITPGVELLQVWTHTLFEPTQIISPSVGC